MLYLDIAVVVGELVGEHSLVSGNRSCVLRDCRAAAQSMRKKSKMTESPAF